MSFRTEDVVDAIARALEELRSADRMLAAVPGAGPALLRMGSWFPFDFVTGSTWADEFAAHRVEVEGAVLQAQAHVRRAVALTDGWGWTGGIADDGNRLLLDTPVGLRRAVREFFARLVASDARLAAVEPLGEL